MTSVSKHTRESKDLRLRKQLFPDAENLVFNTDEKGFIPVPIIFRKLLRRLSPPQSRLLLYLQLRTSKESICYPSLDEITHDLGLSSRRKLTPHLRALEEMKFISTKTSEGKKYFLIHHPRIAVQKLLAEGKINDDELFEINELLRILKQNSIERNKAATKKAKTSK